jgi:hypothetical protein
MLEVNETRKNAIHDGTEISHIQINSICANFGSRNALMNPSEHIKAKILIKYSLSKHHFMHHILSLVTH